MRGAVGSLLWLAAGSVVLYAGLRAAGQSERGISVVMLSAGVAFLWAFVATSALFGPVTRLLGGLRWPVIGLLGAALAWMAVRPNPGLGMLLLLVGVAAGVVLAMGWRVLRR